MCMSGNGSRVQSFWHTVMQMKTLIGTGLRDHGKQQENLSGHQPVLVKPVMVNLAPTIKPSHDTGVTSDWGYGYCRSSHQAAFAAGLSFWTAGVGSHRGGSRGLQFVCWCHFCWTLPGTNEDPWDHHECRLVVIIINSWLLSVVYFQRRDTYSLLSYYRSSNIFGGYPWNHPNGWFPRLNDA